MATSITFDQIQNNSLKIEGTLAYIVAWRNKVILSFLIKFLLSMLRKIEQDFDLGTVEKDKAEQAVTTFKNMFEKYEKALPHLLDVDLPFYTKKDKERVVYYSEYLEDVIEALEIVLDADAASKIELLAKEAIPSNQISPWREALEQI